MNSISPENGSDYNFEGPFFDIPLIQRKTRASIESSAGAVRLSRKVLNSRFRRDPLTVQMRAVDRAEHNIAVKSYADLASSLYTSPEKINMADIKPTLDFLARKRTYLSDELLARASQ